MTQYNVHVMGAEQVTCLEQGGQHSHTKKPQRPHHERRALREWRRGLVKLCLKAERACLAREVLVVWCVVTESGSLVRLGSDSQSQPRSCCLL
jgi:hypothetical protein